MNINTMMVAVAADKAIDQLTRRVRVYKWLAVIGWATLAVVLVVAR